MDFSKECTADEKERTVNGKERTAGGWRKEIRNIKNEKLFSLASGTANVTICNNITALINRNKTPKEAAKIALEFAKGLPVNS